MTLLRLEPTRQRRATADSERVSARQARAAPLPPLPDPHAIVPSTLPPSMLSLVAVPPLPLCGAYPIAGTVVHS